MATYEVWADWFQYHNEGKELINSTLTKALAATENYAAGDVLSGHESLGEYWIFLAGKQNGCSGDVNRNALSILSEDA